MFGLFKKKKITEPIKKDRMQYVVMEEKVDESIHDDRAAIDSVKTIQRQTIRTLQDHDQKIKEIQAMMGIEENIEDQVAFTPKSQEMIISTLDNTLTTCNMLNNLQDVEEMEGAKQALAKMLCTFVQSEMDYKFEKSLDILERCGMLDDMKYQKHKRAVTHAKMATTIGTYALFDVAPLAVNYFKEKSKKGKWADFIIASYAYINEELNPIMTRHICSQLCCGGIVSSQQEALKILNRRFKQCQMNMIPMLDNRIQFDLDREIAESIAKSMVSHCDLKDPSVYDRAGDVVSSFLHISSYDTDKILMDAQQSQTYLSQLISFSSGSYQTFFADFIKNIQNAQEFARYDIEADIYKKYRDDKKDTFDAMVRNVMDKKGIFLTCQKRADIIMANAKMMERTLNPSIDFATTIRIAKRNKKVLTYMEVEYK